MNFSYARVALKYGLSYLKLEKDSEVLIPDFICDAILHSFNDLDIKYRYYSLQSDLTPNWNSIEIAKNSNTMAIMMVHYFGFPQNIDDFQLFCKINNLLLIEDNAHGYGSIFNGQKLGKFGNIAINSPRKTLGLKSGGQLLINGVLNPSLIEQHRLLPRFKVKKSQFILNKILDLNYFIKSNLRYYLKQQPDFSDPMAFIDENVIDMRIDSYSEKKMNLLNFEKIAKKRRDIYLIWEKFAIKKGLKPLYKKLNKGVVPQVFPAYVQNIDERASWFNWGWENRYNIHSWPNLPDIVVKEKRNGFTQWEKLVCFPIDLTMNVTSLEEKLNKL
jgi:perosamine synthetase